VEPDKRFPSASGMAAELRRVAGVKLVPSLRVAALVRAGFGERIRTRREELERGEVVPRAPAPVRPPEAALDLEVSSSRPTPVPEPLVTTRPPPPLVEPTTTFDSVPVTMSSDPPTQPRGRPVDGSTDAPASPANMEVPAAPAVPRELLDMADSAVAQPMPPEASALSAPPLSHAPSVLPTEKAALTPRKGRAAVYVAVAGVILALGGLLAWLGLKGAAPSDIATAAASASVAVPPPPATPTAVDVPTAQAPAEPAPSAAAAPTETSAPSAAPPTGSPAAPPTPAVPAKPRAIKYDPQGI
jgi:DNA polymerase-3 subunit gamma/tau